jgi:hypothetical protein
MKKNNLLAVFFLFLCSFANGQVIQPNTSTTVQGAWNLLDETDYSIQYPANWNLDTSRRLGQGFIFAMSPNQIKDLFKIKIGVNLMTVDLTRQIISLDSIAKIEEQRYENEKTLTNARLLESKRYTANGIDFHKIIASFEYKNVMYKSVQHILMQNGKVYMLSFFGEEDLYNNYREVGEKILGTFCLK